MLWLLVTLIVVVVSIAIAFLLLRPIPAKYVKGSIQVVVLGDIGHSPRMQYHALSIAEHGGQVELVGYIDSEPLQPLREHPSVILRPLSRPPQVLQTSNKLLFLLGAPLKVIFQTWTLWEALARQATAHEWMLVQNPPSIPTLLLAILACRARNTKLVVDWHNFGYSILALKLGHSHLLVRVSKYYEYALAKFAYCHFTVTDAMRDVLKNDLAIAQPILTLHDRPAPIFQPMTSQQRAAFLVQQALTAGEASEILQGKTRLVVSSTSWTPDEDFSVLLEALCKYSASAISDSPQLPELLVIITGKGPLRDRYLQKIKSLEASQDLEMITVKTDWLSFEQYASLLAAADLGLSLHTSSSGVDLPMKVVDMFGAGLPVLGYNNYKAWPELVREDVNGKGFANAQQMSDTMRLLFDPPPTKLDKLKQGAIHESNRRWDAEWEPIAGRLFGLVT
ncbi:mannosyltransferase [Lithohypha guttulata]|uniref:mannosyltransferase n=1 Tax=Lithohypha guttulata TaxID=1690604 RepID=UPI002DDDEB58|nr:mannosyltransferase [Lithohypha guttulata]